MTKPKTKKDIQKLDIRETNWTSKNLTLRDGCSDFSWWIDVRYSGVMYEFEFGSIEEKYADWLLYIERKSPLYKLLFLNSSVDPVLLSLLHSFLDSTVKISEIRWYKNAKNWNKNPEVYSKIPNLEG